MPPFVSESQRRYLWAKHPDVAKKWAKETPKGKRLPKYKKSKVHSNPGVMAPYPHTPKWI